MVSSRCHHFFEMGRSLDPLHSALAVLLFLRKSPSEMVKSLDPLHCELATSPVALLAEPGDPFVTKGASFEVG